MADTLDPALLEILVCPEDHGSLHYLAAEGALYNPRLRRVYEVRDGIAVMLIEESRSVDDAEHGRLMALVDAAG